MNGQILPKDYFEKVSAMQLFYKYLREEKLLARIGFYYHYLQICLILKKNRYCPYGLFIKACWWEKSFHVITSNGSDDRVVVDLKRFPLEISLDMIQMFV